MTKYGVICTLLLLLGACIAQRPRFSYYKRGVILGSVPVKIRASVVRKKHNTLVFKGGVYTYNSNMPIGGMDISNMQGDSARVLTHTDSLGFFEVPVKSRDTLRFDAPGYERFFIVIGTGKR
ncbi:hypothetical protein ACTHGU_01435 [Chitinophagaceae bacterium MMS25-I14]